MTSTTVGGYTLLAKIGEGGMGVVHLARREGGPRVALKVLRPHIVGDDEARARLAREVSSLSRIRSRWVAEIVDADPWAPVPYVATRYVPGLSLHDHVHEEGVLEGADLTWFAACLAEGVASVHAVGVLHRDVKPSNVLMEGRTPILIDFGLARVADDPKLTHTGWLLGTPGFLAPEILHGEDATPASDVHSWAATVAYAALGRPPFGRGPSMAIMDRVRRGEHDLTGVEPDVGRLLAAALDPDPVRRPTIPQILEHLHTLSGAPAPQVRAPAPPAVDPFTLPLALAGHQAAARSTDVLTGGAPVPTRLDEPQGTLLFPEEQTLREQRDPEERAGRAPWDDDPFGDPTEIGPARAPWPERLRRLGLLSSAAALGGAALAAYPWPVLTVLLLVTWLLRSGSLAASAAGDRRRLRGRRWYDGMQFLLRAPWDLVRSIPGTVALVLWAGGLALAAALVCYAFRAAETTTLLVSGVALCVALWTGPGASRVRSPVSRVVRPLSQGWQSWLAAVVVLLALAAAALLLVGASGVDWSPGHERPLSGQVSGHFG